LISNLLFTETTIPVPNLNERSKMSVKLKIKELILKLLSKERAQLNKDYSCGNFDWGNVDQTDVDTREDPLHNRGIYSMLEIPRLYPVPPHVVNFMREHELDLKQLVLGYTKIPLIICKFCDVELDNVPDLRLHLLSKLHDDRVKYFTQY
jgi:ATP-dependent RNA helicase TDRD9